MAVTLTPDEIGEQMRIKRVLSDFRRVINRYVLTLNRNQFSAEDAIKFARWRQGWYDEAAKRVGVHTLALYKEEQRKWLDVVGDRGTTARAR